ncbi:MAG TPA: hypothetical protein VGP76_06935 [Planctomycetaceae bacterium]|jgi:hypothetical protein|nr:hypothetical protein [Planctomycetaceae bacterium]
MSAAVSLTKFVSALEFAGPGAAVRIDTSTGEVVEGAEPAISVSDQAERYQTIAVEVDEQDLARRFCEAVADPTDRKRLETALSSSQSLESFENTVHRVGLAHRWFPFRERQLGEWAKACLEARGIPFVDDLG